MSGDPERSSIGGRLGDPPLRFGAPENGRGPPGGRSRARRRTSSVAATSGAFALLRDTATVRELLAGEELSLQMYEDATRGLEGNARDLVAGADPAPAQACRRALRRQRRSPFVSRSAPLRRPRKLPPSPRCPGRPRRRRRSPAAGGARPPGGPRDAPLGPLRLGGAGETLRPRLARLESAFRRGGAADATVEKAVRAGARGRGRRARAPGAARAAASRPFARLKRRGDTPPVTSTPARPSGAS